MVNYDLPWNPNRLEQRFGRIHRIGQHEVCRLWNLLSSETREGHVYQRLLEKLQQASVDLGGQVFDVLGTLMAGTPLRELLLRSIREDDTPEMRSWLTAPLDTGLDIEEFRRVLRENMLVEGAMDLSQVERIRIEMERANLARLQPHFIKRFFRQACQAFNIHWVERESGRYQIDRVPLKVREQARTLGRREQVQRRYERICFDKEAIYVANKPQADLICPGHILLDTLIAMAQQQYGNLLKAGLALIDRTDPGDRPRMLYALEHTIHSAESNARGEPNIISRTVHFLECDLDGRIRQAGPAPYLDYEPPTPAELARLQAMDRQPNPPWQPLDEEMQRQVMAHARELAAEHLAEVRQRHEERLDKILQAVNARLTREILYWDQAAVRYSAAVRAGKRNAELNRQQARERADRLEERLEARTQRLKAERQLNAAPPLLVGRMLVLPQGLIGGTLPASQRNRRAVEAAAMQAVMEAEIAQGYDPTDVSAENRGYDIESRDPAGGHTRFLEVKGYGPRSRDITVTRNEILRGLNGRDGRYALVLVAVDDDGGAGEPAYIWNPFDHEPDDDSSGVNYFVDSLLARAG